MNTCLVQYLLAQPDLASRLAAYDGRAAVFDRAPPPEGDPAWQGGTVPRVVLTLTKARDPDKATDGVLTFEITCGAGEASGEIETVLTALVDGFFFTEGAETLQAVRETAPAQTRQNGAFSETVLSFSLFSFPLEAGTGETPDPAALLREHSRELFPGAFVFGLDIPAQSVWKPETALPALYWRLQETGPCSYIEDNWNCIWQTATLRLHVFPGDCGEAVCRRVCDDLLTRRRLLFPGGDGQLMIDDARFVPGNDPQRAGQGTLVASFGVLRPQEVKTKLWNIHYDDGQA